jgi:hypothetical protein
MDRRRRRRRTKHQAYEFKPDPKQFNFLKQLYMTRQQRLTLLKWGSYVLTGIFLLVIQDVIMSNIRFSGATTDLPAAFILLVGIYEGLEHGSVFTLAASLFYWFSGSAPTPVCVAILCVLAILVGMFRQMYWHRSFGSITLCVCIAIMLYEMLLFVLGLFQGLTIVDRAGIFALTGAASCITTLPMYPLVRKISEIGGVSWKE